jgi:hypothetical protein
MAIEYVKIAVLKIKKVFDCKNEHLKLCLHNNWNRYDQSVKGESKE